MRLLRSSQRHEMRLINRADIKNPKLQSLHWNLGFIFFLKFKKTYAFLFKAAVLSREIADLSIFNFPDIVSITKVASEISVTFP